MLLDTNVPPDDQVVARVLEGHRESFGLLVRRYLPAIHAVASARLHGSVDAEDAVQETFLTAFTSLQKLREHDRFGAWLVGIARHVCLKAFSIQQRSSGPIYGESGPLVVEPDFGRRELHRLLRQKLAELAEPQREVVFLYYFANMDLGEIARLTDISYDAAAKRLQRARETLGEQMLKEIRPALESKHTAENRHRTIMAAVMLAPAGPSVVRFPRPRHSTVQWLKRYIPNVSRAEPFIVASCILVPLAFVLFVLHDKSDMIHQGTDKTVAPPTQEIDPGNSGHTLAGTVSGLKAGQTAIITVLRDTTDSDAASSSSPRATGRTESRPVRTYRNGAFRVPGLSPGHYTVTVSRTANKVQGKGSIPLPQKGISKHVIIGESPEAILNVQLED